MKSVFNIILSLLIASACFAAEPEPIVSFVQAPHDSIWYIEQIESWKTVTERDLKNEAAWRNLFKAMRYAAMTSDNFDYSTIDTTMMQMKQAIPESFAYYLSMYELSLTREIRQDSMPDYGQLAISKLGDHAGGDDVFPVLGYLIMSGNADDSTSEYHPKWEQLMGQLYANRNYPDRLVRYIYNQFQGMDADALYFADGDNALFPAYYIQENLHKHTDKQVICMSFFFNVKSYREAVARRLGISLDGFESVQPQTWEEYDEACKKLVKYVIKTTGREAYFFPKQGSNHGNMINLLADSLYNEGLVLHYSDHKYDNKAVARRNVESRYHFDYLSEPDFSAQNKWSTVEQLQINYAIMLSNLIQSYKDEGNAKRAKWLSDILRAAVVNTTLDDESKQQYLQLLNEVDK